MTRSFYNGITGVKSFQTSIDIWGDNISNINTIGYKEKTPDFDTLISQSLTGSISDDVGLGTTITSAALDTKAGSIFQTDNPFDLALSGEGWFAVSKNNQTFYTRNGTFSKDAEGFLVNEGRYLLASNANNLSLVNGEYIIDPNKKPDILNSQFSRVFLPDNIIFPNIPTSEINLEGLIYDNTTISNAVLATKDLSLSALYNNEGNFLNLKDNQDLLVGFGNRAIYENGKIKSTFCIQNEYQDHTNSIIQLQINGKNIEVIIPDGSSAYESANIISRALRENGIENSVNNNELTIYSENELVINSNVDFIPKTSAKILYYSSTPTSNNSFDSIDEFINQIKNIASKINQNISIEYADGKIKIFNNSNENITSYFDKAGNSNEMFLDELTLLNNTITPQKALYSKEFKANQQSFSSTLITNNAEGNITFNFIKSKVLEDSTIFKTEIIINDNISTYTNTYELTFDNNGNLLSPTQITLTEPQNITISLNLLKNSVGTNFKYSKNGIKQGSLNNYQIDSFGNILGVFTNGQSVALAQIPIFHFQNDRGLDNVGGNLYTETINSNKAFLYSYNGEYIPGAKIISGALENSNVQLSNAMTELIVNQKAFNANAKTVTTSDEMIKRAIELKR